MLLRCAGKREGLSAEVLPHGGWKERCQESGLMEDSRKNCFGQSPSGTKILLFAAVEAMCHRFHRGAARLPNG